MKKSFTQNKGTTYFSWLSTSGWLFIFGTLAQVHLKDDTIFKTI
jgi:hypothetical protein